MFCSSCGENIQQTRFFPGYTVTHGIMDVIFRNVHLGNCGACQKDVLAVRKGIKEIDITQAIARSLASFPRRLNEKEATWAIGWLVSCAGYDEGFALWLGFDNFYFLKKWNLSLNGVFNLGGDCWESEKCRDAIIFVREIRMLLGKKLGFSFQKYNDSDALVSIGEDKRIKEVLKIPKDNEILKSKIERRDEKYFICVDMESEPSLPVSRPIKQEFQQGEEEDLIEASPELLEEVNSLLFQAGYETFAWPAFDSLIKKEGLVMLLLKRHTKKESKVVASAFCFKNQADDGMTISVFNCAVDKRFIGDNKIVFRIIRKIVKHAINFGAKAISFEKPKQAEVEQMAINCGFTKITESIYAMYLI